jgi:hypothetical protein
MDGGAGAASILFSTPVGGLLRWHEVIREIGAVSIATTAKTQIMSW